MQRKDLGEISFLLQTGIKTQAELTTGDAQGGMLLSYDQISNFQGSYSLAGMSTFQTNVWEIILSLVVRVSDNRRIQTHALCLAGVAKAGVGGNWDLHGWDKCTTTCSPAPRSAFPAV